MVCPGKCWKEVSGGVVDGNADHPYYRYGGAWKNKVAGASAKKPKNKKGKKEEIKEWSGEDKKFTVNDKVVWEGKVWVCRKSHFSREEETPGKGIGLWKEDDVANASREEEDATGPD